MKIENQGIFKVESCVCDYAVIDTTQPPNEQIIHIFNCRANALKVAEILNTDYMQNDKGFYVVWKDKQTTDLEAKLAESEEKCEELKQAISKCTGELPPNVAFDIANDDIRYQIVCNLIDKNQEHRNTIKELKQQLAEKEKEIDEVRSNHANLVADIAYKAVNVYTAESKKTGCPTFYKIHYSQLLEIEDMDNLRNYAQDKISFAVEQLEKVKEIMSKSNESGYIIRFASMDDREKFNKEIEQQIKELKGGAQC